MKLARRRLLVGSVAGLAVYGTSVAWRKRYFLRIFHRTMGSPGTLTQTQMLPSEVGTLSAHEKETLWELYGALGRTWDMDPGSRAAFLNLLDLKTQQPPSYLAEYRNAASRFTQLRANQPAESAARAMTQPHNGDDLGRHASDFVAREYIVQLLMSGGFRRFGLGKYPGYPGGQGGYRLSKHEGKAPG